MTKHILITGASSGIGKQLAIKLSQQGYTLSLCGRQQKKLNNTLEQLDDRVKIYSETFCLSELDSLTKFVKHAQKKLGPIDILVNCAGLNSSRAPASDPDWKQLQHMLDINYFAPLRLIHAVLPSMRERSRGIILNVLSTTCLFANPNTAQYSASKAALDMHTKVLRKELNGSGIKVLSLYPGGVNTDFRAADRQEYLQAEDVAEAALSMLFTSDNSHIHELIIRPEIEMNY
ncbi:SDR family NAD(P)-dependent oxidoreductase [Colwellia piezophila]|uniref:SDR family NAD(P)-dependent oxidoreductase n=1 Tax=Colwellia piezophila TaxID=211668 RepID=UPI000381F58D|nr:SDR family oxidoreductase [Colwellia piezophila]